MELQGGLRGVAGEAVCLRFTCTSSAALVHYMVHYIVHGIVHYIVRCIVHCIVPARPPQLHAGSSGPSCSEVRGPFSDRAVADAHLGDTCTLEHRASSRPLLSSRPLPVHAPLCDAVPAVAIAVAMRSSSTQLLSSRKRSLHEAKAAEGMTRRENARGE